MPADPARSGARPASPVTPLAGVRFVEAGRNPAASYAGRLLVLLGAEVVKMVPGRRDVVTPAASDPLDAGKLVHEGGGGSHPDAWREVPAAAVIDGTGRITPAVDSCPVVAAPPVGSAAEEWAASGSMALTAMQGRAMPAVPGAAAVAMRGAALALRVLAACRGYELSVDGPALFGERAALLGLGPGTGDVSASGYSHLLRAADGWLAVTLNRPDDLGLLPAVLARPGPLHIADLRAAAAGMAAGDLAARAQLLGIPAATVGPPSGEDEQLAARGQGWPPAPWLVDGRVPSARAEPPGPDRFAPCRPVSRRVPLVVDLSALWAGPLATSLLLAAGCRVVKVEDPGRPDSTRSGPAAFFDLLNGGKESVTVPFTPDGPLASLVASADVVVEASRPRAMEQLGIEPSPDQLWVSLTGYGRTGPWRQRVALGDDAAVAGGLVVRDGPEGAPLFCGDAAADPVSGLHAAVAILAGVAGGFRGTIDLAMREVVGHAVGRAGTGSGDPRAGDARGAAPRAAPPPAPPRARRPAAPGPELGGDTAAVLASL